MAESLRSFIIHRMTLLRKAIEKEHAKLDPNQNALNSLIIRLNELDYVLKEFSAL